MEEAKFHLGQWIFYENPLLEDSKKEKSIEFFQQALYVHN